MNPAVLLITFNRPEYTRTVISALKIAGIQRLYIFKDGPRPNNINDYNASKEIEDIVKSIDWKCEVCTNYMQNNLGCGYGPYSAISWAFQYEEELVILEDDCVPTSAFFDFCSCMLEKYKNEKKISVISGRSPLSGHKVFAQYDYIFSQYAQTLGWATWKRVWNDFDIQMRELDEFFAQGGFSDQFSSKEEALYFNKRYFNDKNDLSLRTHVWDNFFGYHSRANGALRIVPSHNLIKYIGFDGTHPSNPNSTLYTKQIESNFIFNKCPKLIEILPEYDYEYFCSVLYHKTNIFSRVWAKIRSLICSK